MNPIKASLRYPAVTLSLTLGLLLAGTQAILHMPRMEDPSVTIRTGIVAAIYPGATSDQVESQVAKKMEDHLFKFAEVRKEKTYSTSRPGLLLVNVELQDSVRDSDEFWSKLRHDLNEAHAGGEFPPGVVGIIVDSDFGDTVAMLVAIHGSRYGNRELKDYVKRIEDELRTVPNVAKLRRYGEQKEQIWITGSLQRSSQYLANPAQVVQASRQRNIIEDSGALLIPARTSRSRRMDCSSPRNRSRRSWWTSPETQASRSTSEILPVSNAGTRIPTPLRDSMLRRVYCFR